jgi:hypothetical protein
MIVDKDTSFAEQKALLNKGPKLWWTENTYFRSGSSNLKPSACDWMNTRSPKQIAFRAYGSLYNFLARAISTCLKYPKMVRYLYTEFSSGWPSKP